MTYDKSHTWFEIDFGDVEELCIALDQATVFAYKEHVDGGFSPLEFRVRVIIEADKVFVTSRSANGEYERELELACSPFGNPKFAHLPDSIRPPHTVAFMIDPKIFCHYLREIGSKCEIMLPDLSIRWITENVKAVTLTGGASSKRRPI